MPEGLQIRTFLCIELPSPVRSRSGDLQRRFSQCGANVSWVRPENLHLTLKFLGEISRGQLEHVCAAAKKSAENIVPFSIELSGTGCFPSERNPKVLWLGLPTIPHGLRELHRSLEQELSRLGFPRDERPFSPHLTLGRVRSIRAGSTLVKSFRSSDFSCEPFSVYEFLVMKSELRSSGALYTPIERVQLLSQH